MREGSCSKRKCKVVSMAIGYRKRKRITHKSIEANGQKLRNFKDNQGKNGINGSVPYNFLNKSREKKRDQLTQRSIATQQAA